MDTRPLHPLISSLSSKYQAPIEQILRYLQLEPSTTRTQNISCLQETFQSLVAIIQTPCSPPLPSCSLLEPRPNLLPPLYHPSSPYRDLPTLSVLPLLGPLPGRLPQPAALQPLLDTAPASPSLPPPSVTSKSILDRPSKRRRTGESTSSIAAESAPQDKSWIAITPDASERLVVDAAASFQQQLQNLEVLERKNNSVTKSRIHPADVPLLVQFFFHHTFGEACQKRMYTLFSEITQPKHASAPTTSIAAQRATDRTLLPEMQAFFSSYARWQIEEEKQARLIPEVIHTIRAFELYHAFFQLREKGAGPRGHELRTFLAEQGFPTSVGRDVRSCILKYFARELGITSGQLSNTLQAYQGIFLLAQQFGKGILILLPKGTSNRMTRIGTQKSQRIIEILFTTLPQAVEVCSAAEFLIPYITGETNPTLLTLLEPLATDKLSLLETFTTFRPIDNK